VMTTVFGLSAFEVDATTAVCDCPLALLVEVVPAAVGVYSPSRTLVQNSPAATQISTGVSTRGC
jgi:hypothetical protein